MFIDDIFDARDAAKREYDLLKKNKEAMKAQHTAYQRRITLEVYSHYGKEGKPVCVTCGEARIGCLSIDHINGGGSKHRQLIGKGGHNFHRWLKMEGYPEGYQTLCMNCQFIKQRQQKNVK